MMEVGLIVFLVILYIGGFLVTSLATNGDFAKSIVWPILLVALFIRSTIMAIVYGFTGKWNG